MKTMIALGAALLIGPASVRAQESYRAGAGVGLESLNFASPATVGVQSVSLLTVPMSARVRVFNTLALEASTAWASGRLERSDGTGATLSGLTDTEVRLVLNLGQGLATITGIVHVPTGQSALSLDEAELAGFVAADVLPFRISNWGTGGGAGLNAAITRRLGDFGAGLSVGYVVAQEFEPVAGQDFSYRPGNQLVVRAAADRTIGPAGKVALVLSMQHYADDKVDGTNLFRPGPRYDATASYAFALRTTGAGIVYAGYLRRARSDYLQIERVLPVQELIYAGTGFEMPVGAALLRPRGDLRILRRADGVAQGFTTSVGADVEWRFSNVTLVPTALGRFGNLVLRDGVESGFSGFDLGLAVRFGAGNP